MQTVPRGIRVNNPGDIDASQVPWLGEVHPSRDTRFATFIDMQHGVRACAELFLTYELKYQLHTIEAKCSRWAPPSENATVSYSEEVAKYCGVRPSDTFLVSAGRANMRLLLQGVFHAEGTGSYVTDAVLRAGIALAF